MPGSPVLNEQTLPPVPLTVAANDPQTFTFTRSPFNAAGSNLWEDRVAGTLTGYANEGGELRSRAFNGSRVAFRCQSAVAGDNTTVDIFEATLSDNTPQFKVDALGHAQATVSIGTAGKNGLSPLNWCGRSTTPGAPSSGTWLTGDAMVDSANAVHYCTAGGTPGTWT
jgi:hypothetical protein